MAAELLIQRGKKLLAPAVEDGIEWTTEREGVPGKLAFKARIDDTLSVEEGNAVRFKWDGNKIFYGFVFTKKRDKENVYTITAYDQLRYLKNKATYSYTKKRADEVVKMVASDFGLRVGDLENTKHVIASRVEDESELFDVIQNALDDTLQNKTKLYVLYDDFGKLTLKSVGNMKVNLVIDAETGGNFEYSSSIDDDTYNQIKLYYDNEDTGKREVYIAKDSSNINRWGLLQYYESIDDGEDGKTKADKLLELYNTKTRTLTIQNAIGDVRVRAGSMIGVILDLADVQIKNMMLVETCKHTFKENEHWMELKLRGDEFVV